MGSWKTLKLKIQLFLHDLFESLFINALMQLVINVILIILLHEEESVHLVILHIKSSLNNAKFYVAMDYKMELKLVMIKTLFLEMDAFLVSKRQVGHVLDLDQTNVLQTVFAEMDWLKLQLKIVMTQIKIQMMDAQDLVK